MLKIIKKKCDELVAKKYKTLIKCNYPLKDKEYIIIGKFLEKMCIKDESVTIIKDKRNIYNIYYKGLLLASNYLSEMKYA